MSMEISGPPGGGKSSIALAIAMSARLSSGNFADSVQPHDQSEKGEVLLIGMQSQYHLRTFDRLG